MNKDNKILLLQKYLICYKISNLTINKNERAGAR